MVFDLTDTARSDLNPRGPQSTRAVARLKHTKDRFSAGAAIGEHLRPRQQCGGLLTLTALAGEGELADSARTSRSHHLGDLFTKATTALRPKPTPWSWLGSRRRP